MLLSGARWQLLAMHLFQHMPFLNINFMCPNIPGIRAPFPDFVTEVNDKKGGNSDIGREKTGCRELAWEEDVEAVDQG